MNIGRHLRSSLPEATVVLFIWLPALLLTPTYSSSSPSVEEDEEESEVSSSLELLLLCKSSYFLRAITSLFFLCSSRRSFCFGVRWAPPPVPPFANRFLFSCRRELRHGRFTWLASGFSSRAHLCDLLARVRLRRVRVGPVPPPALADEALMCCSCRPSSSELSVSESPKRKLDEGEEAQSLNEDSTFRSSSLRASRRGGGMAASLSLPSFKEQSEGPGCWLFRFFRLLSESLRPPVSLRGRCLVSPHSAAKSPPALLITSTSEGKLLAVSMGSGLTRGPFSGSCLRRASVWTSLFIASGWKQYEHSRSYVSISRPLIPQLCEGEKKQRWSICQETGTLERAVNIQYGNLNK